MINLDDLNSVPIESLENYLREANNEYRKGTPIISDEIYDVLYDNLKERDPENIFLKTLSHGTFGSESGTSETVGLKVELPYKVFSLDKIKAGENQLNIWKSKYPGPVVVSEKLDGNSAIITFSKNKIEMYKTGDGYTGQIISHLLPYIKNIPQTSDVDVRGELIISKDDWTIVSKKFSQYSNARNAVGGIINSKVPNAEVAKYIQFVAFEILSNEPSLPLQSQFEKLKINKFKLPDYKILHEADNTVLSNYLLTRREASEFEIDGIVVTSNISYTRPSDGNPKYSFAFKSVVTQEQIEVTVTNVSWAISKDGILNPLVHFPTIVLEGVNINKATGKNAKFIEENVIGIGSRIIIIRAGGVIPDIYKITKAAPKGPGLPTTEDLGNDLSDYEGLVHWNDNHVELEVDISELKKRYGLKSKLYREYLIKRYTQFFVTIDVEGVSEGLISRIFNSGKTNLKEILNISIADLLNIEGIKERSAQKIKDAITGALMKLIEDPDGSVKLMVASGSFGAGFGEKRLKLITTYIPKILSEKYIPSLEEMIAIPGIAEITALQFINKISEFWEFIKENDLEKYIVVKILAPKKISEKYKALFENKTYVFTGFRNEELKKLITESGGKVSESVSKKTYAVIVKDDEGKSSSKAQKALELGINLYTIEEFKKLL